MSDTNRDTGRTDPAADKAADRAADGQETPRRALAGAAQRALAEAEARRVAATAREAAAPREIGGRGGNDPARYGDWEVKGIACDF